MGLALYLKFDDAGESIEDFAWHADWRAFWVHAVAPATADPLALPPSIDDVVLDGNDAPTAPEIAIEPAAIGKLVAMDALLRARIVLPSSDPDGAMVSYRYYWFQGPAGLAADTIVRDDNNDGLWTEGEALYSDANANGIVDGTDIELVAAGATSLSNATSLDLADIGAVAGESYFAVVVPVDELGKDGEFAVDFVITADRTAPDRPTFLSLTPDLAQEGDALVLGLRNTSGPGVSFVVDWYRNAEFFLTTTVDPDDPLTVGVVETDASIVLDGSLTCRGDLWSFMAYARDDQGGLSRPTYGTGTTTQVRVTRVIGGGAGSAADNQPPTAPTSVVVTPETPFTEDMLICSASGSVDPEGDAFAYFYQWYQYDATASGYVAVAGMTTPLLDEDQTTPGDRWFCQVFAVDVYGNQSVTISSNPVLIANTIAGGYAYEPNDSADQARRILPKDNPLSLTDTAVQSHTFASASDHDWFWFVVEDGPGYEQVTVTFETNGGDEMWTAQHDADTDATDTVLALYRASSSGAPRFIRQVDDYGTVGQLGGTRYARIVATLDPGVYYVQVWTTATLAAGTNDAYTAHLWFELPSGASGPSAPTSVALRPTEPLTSDDLVCEARGAVSPLGEGHITYHYVWFRDGMVVPFGGGAQSYEGTNYILANAKPALSADGSAANVVPSQYTREGEVWSCTVFAVDDNGESAGVSSNTVTVGSAGWSQIIAVDKTFTDGTAAVTQTVTIGWLFDATHGFDIDIDADLPTAVPAPGDPSGPPTGPGGSGTTVVSTPAGSTYVVGLEAEHTRLTTDMRPYGDLTSWYLKIELGSNPASCRIHWADLALPITDTPLTITRVEEGPYGEFYPVSGTTLDMSEVDEIVVDTGASTVLYRISLGTGDDNQTISLNYGWNMVSFAIQPITPAVRSVFSFNGQQVISGVAWAYSNGGYVAVTEIEAKVGYWVFCPFTTGATFTVHGMPVSGALSLKAGWNLVGPAVTTDVETAYAAYGTTSGNGSVDLLNVMALDPATMAYSLVTTMEPGQAYWIRAYRNVELPAPATRR